MHTSLIPRIFSKKGCFPFLSTVPNCPKKTTAEELAELMAYTAESIVFGYFGLTAVAYTSQVEPLTLVVVGNNGGRKICLNCLRLDFEMLLLLMLLFFLNIHLFVGCSCCNGAYGELKRTYFPKPHPKVLKSCAGACSRIWIPTHLLLHHLHRLCSHRVHLLTGAGHATHEVWPTIGDSVWLEHPKVFFFFFSVRLASWFMQVQHPMVFLFVSGEQDDFNESHWSFISKYDHVLTLVFETRLQHLPKVSFRTDLFFGK